MFHISKAPEKRGNFLAKVAFHPVGPAVHFKIMPIPTTGTRGSVEYLYRYWKVYNVFGLPRRGWTTTSVGVNLVVGVVLVKRTRACHDRSVRRGSQQRTGEHRARGMHHAPEGILLTHLVEQDVCTSSKEAMLWSRDKEVESGYVSDEWGLNGRMIHTPCIPALLLEQDTRRMAHCTATGEEEENTKSVWVGSFSR